MVLTTARETELGPLKNLVGQSDTREHLDPLHFYFTSLGTNVFSRVEERGGGL